MSRTDLHMHSAYSLDADLPVSELIDRCMTSGVSTLAVTDHNSVNSVAEARVLGAAKALTVISGIEIDCAFQGNNYHLLGYGFTGDLSDFVAVEQAFDRLQANAVPQKLARLQSLGIFLDETDLYQRAGANIPHEELMAELILDDERNNLHPLLTPYRTGGTRTDMPFVNFFWDFFAAGKSCHIPVVYPALEKMLELIRANRGIPVIAHIGANVKHSQCSVLGEMRKAGIMGVEVFSSYHTEELSAVLYEYAINNGLHVTCGSDFHGRNKPGIEPGSCRHPARAEQAIKSFVTAARASR